MKWFILCIVAALIGGGDEYPGGGQQVTRFSDTAFVHAIAVAADHYDQVFVLDGGTSQILKLSASGEVTGHIGGYGWSGPSLDQPSDVATINGLDIFVADYGNHRIQRLDRNLNLVSSIPAGGEATQSRVFGYPRSVAEGMSGALYIVDGENTRILKVDVDGSQRSFGGLDAADGKLANPRRVRVSTNEIVFVQDSGVVVTYDRFGNYVRTFGKGLFRNLTSFTLDRDTLYALDSCRILRINEHGGLIDSSQDICAMLEDASNQIVDIAVQGGYCLLLMEHSLVRAEIHQLFGLPTK